MRCFDLTNDKINRINQLAKKKRAVGLTDDELAEQKALYKEYIGEFRANLQGQLDNMVIENPDGSVKNVRDMRKK